MDGNNLLGRIVNDVVTDLIDAKDRHDLTDQQAGLLAAAVVVALGGKPERRHPLDWSYTHLQHHEHVGVSARRLREMFPGWSAWPSKPLGDWLKTADQATVVRVAALLHDMGEDIRT